MTEPVSSAVLKIVSGPAQDRAPIRLAGTPRKTKLMFGRHASCDQILDHETISRRHFAIEFTAGKIFVVDQGSENGTFVNDNRVSWLEVGHGDKITAGPFVMLVELAGHSTGGPEESMATAAGAEKADSFGAHSLAEDPFAAPADNYFPREYAEGVHHFNARRYYEAHEVWEEIWLRSYDTEKLFYQMLIQAAVGLHHYERGNMTGARGMHRRVMEKLGALPSVFMSVDLKSFSQQFASFFSELIEQGIEGPPAPSKSRPNIVLLKNRRDSQSTQK